MDLIPPPPPYSASSSPATPHGPASLSNLPLHLLHRILSYTLDQKATPSKWYSDSEEERARRIWGLFRGLRGVDRRFHLVATSILRTLYLDQYQTQLLAGISSDPFPASSIIPTTDTDPSSDFTSHSFLALRGRETAVYDRFIAVRCGEELRKAESELSEESEGLRDIFSRLQPAARVEDLLLSLPTRLITLESRPNYGQLPLSHAYLSVVLTPTWAQVWTHASPVVGAQRGARTGKELVLEVRRQRGCEATVQRLNQGLQDMINGLVSWGGRVE
ncbi:hypothetical protein BCR39DRAFT_535740 [Naematelia encephala]|uniref:Uncharacterized protein n=1 Tax=Naematelia encephala TaxID=71784 RepID=A0A1Y2B013_9TREE|nr:hypothetical protein BCR39DRAFT_535740 [Naematelia encephala]